MLVGLHAQGLHVAADAIGPARRPRQPRHSLKAAMHAESPSSYIRWFGDLGLGDVPAVGGKNASLGELYREMASAGVRVPNGFAITADGYRYFLQPTGLAMRISDLLRGLDVANLAQLAERGLAVRQA